MSARALLLSPDDQAVSAITGVLEELSVLCERPRDGATAAQKLNSQTYDLVLVDCDNLPAAKLIFDVCRRAHAGTTIPIAIVDGRAGLPTAFRLGAELILTKPVAKDQARTTIRTAVSRLRKDEPARVAHTVEAAPFEASAPSIPETFVQAAAAGAASVASAARVVTSPVAPAKPVELTTLPAPVVAVVPEAISAPEQLPPASVKIPETSAPAEKVTRVLYESAVAAPKPPSKPPKESVLEELTTAETELHTPITFSSFDQSKKRNKVRAPMVVLLLLGMMTAAFYAAWMQVPEFRVMVQPQLDKAMSMVGLVSTQKTVAPVPVVQPVVKASVQPTPVPTESVPASPTVAPPVDNAPAPAPAPTSTAAGTAETASPAPSTSAKTTPTAGDDSEKSPEKSKKSAASAPETELPWEKETVILSSKGAEKRLVHQVQPVYSKEARAQKADGTVVLKTLVGGNGSVEGIRLVEGNPALASAATKAVKQWRYKPYIRDGSRTPFQTIVIVDFQQP